MIYAGKVDRDGIYAWLNPPLPLEERYGRERLLSAYVEVDASIYDEFLGCLPPMHFTSRWFAICEARTEDIRLGFFRIGDRYFAAHVSDIDAAHKMDATRKAIEERL